LGCLSVMDVQMRSIIRQVGLALTSHREMPSLLQSSHSPTETHVHGEIVRRRIADRAGRAVGEITGQCHLHHLCLSFPLQLCSREKPMYVSFIGLSLTKTSLTLINRTRLRTKGQSAGYPQAQIGITSNSFQRRAP